MNKKIAVSWIISSSLVGFINESLAQTESEDTLIEIMVTAERREVNLQDTAITATVISGDQLDGKAIQRLDDLQFAIPALSITDQGLTQSVNIRGIGLSSGSPQVSNGVAQYQDGIFQPPIVSATSFYDIGNIEVLRGPQGTFVGTNSTGGAMFVNTANPELDDSISGYIKGGFGSYSSTALEGAVNLPVSDTLALRFSGIINDRDSYYTDLGPLDNSAAELDEAAFRLGVLWDTGNFKSILKVEKIDKSTGGYAYRPIIGTEYAPGRTDDIRDISYDSPTLNDEDALISSLNMDYDFGGTIIRSVTGYLNKEIHNLYDSDATTLTTQSQDQSVRERQWSQEINILSPEEERFSWVIGGYYQINKIDVDIYGSDNGFPTDIFIYTEKTTTGLFAHAKYDLTEALEIEFGVRRSDFDSEGSGGVFIGNGIPGFPGGGLLVANLGGQHEDSGTTGKLGLNWSKDEDNFLYAFISRGYKPGGFNSQTDEFNPEFVTDYELGWKSSLFDGHVNTQLALFYNDYEDFQFEKIDISTGQNGVENVGGSIIKGFELQAQARFGALAFDAGLSYVNSNLDPIIMVNPRLLPSIPGGLGPQCPSGTPSSPPACFDYLPYTEVAGDGDNLFSPDWSFNFGVQYDFTLTNNMLLTPRLNYGYIDNRYTNLFYDPILDLLESRGLWSAMITLNADNWYVEGYGKNLADKEFISGQAADNEFYGAPREFGLRALMRF